MPVELMVGNSNISVAFEDTSHGFLLNSLIAPWHTKPLTKK